MHQFDVLYVPSNVAYGTEYKYILTSIDVASRYKVARALRNEKVDEVAFVLEASKVQAYTYCFCRSIYQETSERTIQTSGCART